MKKTTRISLAYELAEVGDALELVRVACDAIHDERLDTVRERKSASRWCAAVANLCLERLRLVERAVSGREDPRLVATAFNEALDARGDEEDIAIAPWSPKRRRKAAAAELRHHRRKKNAEVSTSSSEHSVETEGSNVE